VWVKKRRKWDENVREWILRDYLTFQGAIYLPLDFQDAQKMEKLNPWLNQAKPPITNKKKKNIIYRLIMQ
jgi:hypothetical protein